MVTTSDARFEKFVSASVSGRDKSLVANDTLSLASDSSPSTTASRALLPESLRIHDCGCIRCGRCAVALSIRGYRTRRSRISCRCR